MVLGPLKQLVEEGEELLGEDIPLELFLVEGGGEDGCAEVTDVKVSVTVVTETGLDGGDFIPSRLDVVEVEEAGGQGAAETGLEIVLEVLQARLDVSANFVSWRFCGPEIFFHEVLKVLQVQAKL